MPRRPSSYARTSKLKARWRASIELARSFHRSGALAQRDQERGADDTCFFDLGARHRGLRFELRPALLEEARERDAGLRELTSEHAFGISMLMVTKCSLGSASISALVAAYASDASSFISVFEAPLPCV